MTLRNALLTATVLVLSAPVVPALAHDDEDYGYSAHDQLHDQLSEAHERAHEQGFRSWWDIGPIIVRFATSMAPRMVINRLRTMTIIQDLAIMVQLWLLSGLLTQFPAWRPVTRVSCREQPCHPTSLFEFRGKIAMSRSMMPQGALAVLAICLVATSASAHPKLTSTSPPADVASKVSPTEIKLNFSEGVIAKFSGLEIKDEGGKTVASGVAATDPKDKKQLVVPLPAPLAAGRYTVTWHAVSEDTHRVEGKYSFTVDR